MEITCVYKNVPNKWIIVEKRKSLISERKKYIDFQVQVQVQFISYFKSHTIITTKLSFTNIDKIKRRL